MSGQPEKDAELIAAYQKWQRETVRCGMSPHVWEMYLRRLDKEREYEGGDGI